MHVERQIACRILARSLDKVRIAEPLVELQRSGIGRYNATTVVVFFDQA